MRLVEKATNRLARFVSRSLDLKRAEVKLRVARQRLVQETREAAAQASCLNFHASESLRSLEGNIRKGGVALVTILPPQESGLATFALRLAEENPGSLDLFASFTKLEDLLGVRGQLRGNTPIHPVELLPEVAARRQYDAVVFAIGNSDHNIPIARAVRLLAPLIAGSRKILQVHDPVLFNLGRGVLREGAVLDLAYGAAYPSVAGVFSGMGEEQLIARGISGMSALFVGTGIDEIVVHSSSAAEILSADMAHGSWRRPVRKLFHPVFRSTIAELPGLEFSLPRPILGVFGVPSSDKRVDLVAAAAMRGIDQGTVGTALFAGYGAERARDLFPSPYQDRVTAIGNPDDVMLERCMKMSDVAVQLRARNLGESSGVIPQLLELGVPVVSSRIGSFAEYGEIVELVEANAGTDDVLRAVGRSLERKEQIVRNTRSYANKHRSHEFLRRITDEVLVF